MRLQGDHKPAFMSSRLWPIVAIVCLAIWAISTIVFFCEKAGGAEEGPIARDESGKPLLDDKGKPIHLLPPAKTVFERKAREKAKNPNNWDSMTAEESNAAGIVSATSTIPLSEIKAFRKAAQPFTPKPGTRFVVTLFTADGCAACKRLESAWRRNENLRRIADIDKPAASWAELRVVKVDLANMPEGLGMTPTIRVHAPASGAFGDFEAPVYVHEGYENDPDVLAHLISDKINDRAKGRLK